MQIHDQFFRRGLPWSAIGCCLLIAGCAKQNVPAEPGVARKSLEAALASWKSGEAPDALVKRAPSITVGDHAWKAGWKLTDYRLLDNAKDDGVNLHYTVELALTDQQGATVSEKVTYIVGTEPAITIFREYAL